MSTLLILSSATHPKGDMSNTETSSRLKGKVAIVTGAGSRSEDIGNGRAASILLARAGARLVLVDIKPEWVQATLKMIEDEAKSRGEAKQVNVVVVIADVTIPGDCKRVVDTAREKFGKLDILVNNVGVDGPPGTAIHVDVKAWEEGLKINVTTMMLMARFAIPEMLRTRPKDISGGTGKAIINLASVAGLQGGHHALLYPTSKGAVINLTRAMAAQSSKFGSRPRGRSLCNLRLQEIRERRTDRNGFVF